MMGNDAQLGRTIRQLLERESHIYAGAGFGSRSVLGLNPALLVVDVTYGFVGKGRRDDATIYPNWCGSRSGSGVAAIERLILRARESKRPVIYTTGSFSGLNSGTRRLGQKHPRAAEQPKDSYTIVRDLEPMSGDLVIRKEAPSAFFGTPLIANLRGLAVDTLVVTGCSTSGCVRATAVDAFSLGFPIVVPREATFDRSLIGHEVTLFEVDQKYGDVVSEEQALEYLSGPVTASTKRGGQS